MSDNTAQTNDGAAPPVSWMEPFADASTPFALLFAVSTIATLPEEARARWDRLLAQGKRDRAMDLLCKYAVAGVRAALGGLLEDNTEETLTNLLARFGGVQQGFIREVKKEGAAEEKKRRDRGPNPLIVERDREIVRLRDEEKLTFGKIAIRINRWLESKHGRQLKQRERMNYRSVQAAYYREKNDTN
jgi:hypothetical protein